jgi:hypothetical protein
MMLAGQKELFFISRVPTRVSAPSVNFLRVARIHRPMGLIEGWCLPPQAVFLFSFEISFNVMQRAFG